MCYDTRQVTSRLCVAFVVAALLVTSIAVLYTVRIDNDPRWQISSVHQYFHITFVVLTFMAFTRTILIGPGGTDSWTVERPDLIFPNIETTVSSDSASRNNPTLCRVGTLHTVENAELERFCKPCASIKPKRVHHCSVCEKCVLRYDHHCPWMGTCIGLLNAKFFLQFLFYINVLSGHALYMLVRTILNLMRPRVHLAKQPGVIVALSLVSPTTLLISAATFFITGRMFAEHMWLAMKNETTLENFRKQKDFSNNGSGRSNVCEYSRGTCLNLRHVLGWNPMFWVVPVRQSRLAPAETVITG